MTDRCVCCLANHQPPRIEVGDTLCVDCVDNHTTAAMRTAMLGQVVMARVPSEGSIFDPPGVPDKISRKHITLKFQSGPTQEAGVNGCQIDEIIQILIDRLEHFQAGEFKCAENNLAIIKLMEAKMWLMERSRDRIARGIEGRSEA